MLNDQRRYGAVQSFSVGEHGPLYVREEVRFEKETMDRVKTYGPTPLAEHIERIRESVAKMAPSLTKEGLRVAVIISTDGLPSNLPSDECRGADGRYLLHQFVESIQKLEQLPVSIVLRLCTDDEKAVDFYNTVDWRLGDLPYDVLDDFHSESLEVYLRNPWLTYALPLHRFRELGVHVPVLDEIDERALSLAELRQFCSVLFGGYNFPEVALPDPSRGWKSFVKSLAIIMAKENPHYNPVTKRVCPWIDLHVLNLIYGSQQPEYFSPEPTPIAKRPLQQQLPAARVDTQNSTSLPSQFASNTQKSQLAQPILHGSSAPKTDVAGAFLQHPGTKQGFQQPPTFQEQPRSYQRQTFGSPRNITQSSPQHRSYQQKTHPRQSWHGHSSEQKCPPSQPQIFEQGPPPIPEMSYPIPQNSQAKMTAPRVTNDVTLSIKKQVLTQWALMPPDFQTLQPISQLLISIQSIFPPAYGVPLHDYFKKWKPFTYAAFSSGNEVVLKRG